MELSGQSVIPEKRIICMVDVSTECLNCLYLLLLFKVLQRFYRSITVSFLNGPAGNFGTVCFCIHSMSEKYVLKSKQNKVELIILL